MGDRWLPTIGILGFIIFWWVMKFLFFKDTIFLAAPGDTFSKLIDLTLHGGLFVDLTTTLYKFFAGFGLAVLIGLPIGFFLGSFKILYHAVELLLDFFRSIPVTTLFPLFILFFGIGPSTIIAMVTASSVFVLILNTSYGVAYTSKAMIEYMEAIGANKMQVLWHVTLPSALPFIFVGLRVAVSFGLIVVIVAEMFIGANRGLGVRVYEAHQTYLIPEVYAIILFVGVLGFFFNKVFQLAEKRIIHWKN